MVNFKGVREDPEVYVRKILSATITFYIIDPQ